MSLEKKTFRRKDRFRSSIFSRIFNLADNESKVNHENEGVTITKDNLFKNRDSYFTPSMSLKTQNSDNGTIYEGDSSDIEINIHRQSRLYTPYHGNSPSVSHGIADNNLLYHQPYTDYNSSQLTRSASWNPQKQQQGQPQQLRNNGQIAVNTDQDITSSNESVQKLIPDRRTSRNYSTDPEAQARINHLLSNERRFFLRGTSVIDRKPSPL